MRTVRMQSSGNRITTVHVTLRRNQIKPFDLASDPISVVDAHASVLAVAFARWCLWCLMPTLQSCRAKAVLARITLWKEKGITVEANRSRNVRFGWKGGNQLLVHTYVGFCGVGESRGMQEDLTVRRERGRCSYDKVFLWLSCHVFRG